ncbi:dockerin type I repeat-containing protein, partial [bacterium]|nr:dockerin type I repeat-containing protein [bacterium]
IVLALPAAGSGVVPVGTPEPPPTPRDTFCDIMISCDIYTYDANAGESVPVIGALIEPVSICDYDSWTTGSDGWACVIYAHYVFDLDLNISADGYQSMEYIANYGNCPASIGLVPAGTLPPCNHDGDVNLDGEVTAGDAQLAFQISLGIYSPTYEQECAADCNADSEVTAADAQLIFIAALEMGSCVDPL